MNSLTKTKTQNKNKNKNNEIKSKEMNSVNDKCNIVLTQFQDFPIENYCMDEKTRRINFVNEYHGWLQRNRMVPSETYFRPGVTDGEWTCVISTSTWSYQGRGDTKKDAKYECVRFILMNEMCEDTPRVTTLGEYLKLTGVSGEMSNPNPDESGEGDVSLEHASTTLLTTAHGNNESETALMPPTTYTSYIDGSTVSFPELCDRFLHFNMIEWPVTAPQGFLLGVYDMPVDLLHQYPNAPNVLPFYQYALSIPQMEYQILLNSTQFHSGTVIVAVRYNDSPSTGPLITDARQLLSMNHVIMQACSANTGVLKVPFLYPNHFLPSVNTASGAGHYYHTLYVGVLNSLGIGDGGSTSVTMQIYARFKCGDEETQFAMQRIRVAGEMGLLDLIPGFSTVKNITGKVESVASGIGSILKSLDQDRPLIPHDRSEIAVHSVPNMALGNGTIDIASMRLSKDKLTPFPPGLVPSDHQCTLEYLKKIKNAIDVISWSNGAARGTLLWQWEVTPLSGFAVGSGYYHTTLAEISSFFQYYSGNLNLEFLFGSSLRHSGRLMVVFLPDNRDVALLDAYSYPYLIYDLAETQTFTFVVPNSNPTHLTPISSRSPSTITNLRYTVGKVMVFVETPLKIMNSVSSVIDITVLLNGHDNYKLHVPTHDVTQLAVMKVNGEMDDERVRDKQMMEILKINDVPEHTTGEEFELLPLMRRFGFMNEYSLKGSDVLFIKISPDYFRSDNSRIDIIKHMTQGFRFSKGGMRFCVTAINNYCNTTFSVGHLPWYDGGEPERHLFLEDTLLSNSIANQVFSSSVNSTVTIDIPYYNNRKFLVNGADQNRFEYESMINSLGYLIIRSHGLPTDSPVTINISRAISDDFEMFVFQGFPLRTNALMSVPLASLTTHAQLVTKVRLMIGSDGTNPVNWYSDPVSNPQPFSKMEPADVLIVKDTSYAVGPTSAVVNDNYVSKLVNKTADMVVFQEISNNVVEIDNIPVSALSPGNYKPVKVTIADAPLGIKYLPYATVGGTIYGNADSAVSSNPKIRDTKQYYNYYTNNIALLDTATTGLVSVPLSYDPAIVNMTSSPVYVHVGSVSHRLAVNGHIVLSNLYTGTDVLAISIGSSLDFSLGPVVAGEMEDPVNIETDKVSNCISGLEKVVDKLRKSGVRISRKILKHFDPKKISVRIQKLHDRILPILLFCSVERADGEMESIRGFVNGIRSVPRLINSVNSVGDLAANVNAHVAAGNDPIGSVTNAAQAIGGTFDKINSALSALGNSVSGTFEWFSSLVKVITIGVPSQISEVAGKVVECTLSLYTFLFSTDIKARLLAVISIFVNIGLKTLDYVTSFKILSSFISTSGTEPVEGEMDNEEFETRYNAVYKWFAYLVPVLCLALGFRSEYGKKGLTAFATTFREAVRFSNDISRFFSFNTTFIKDLISWWYGEERPDLRAIAVLQDRKEDLLLWGEKVVEITQGHRRDQVFASSGQQKHLDLLYREGTEFLSLMHDRRVNSSVFMSLFKKLADLHQAVGQRVGRGRLLKEPLRLWFYGPPGTGKSTVAANVSVELLVHKGVVYDGNPVYTRNFTEWWNGWADQPVVLYDDFYQNRSPEETSRLINEFFSLASIAEFNAPMPAIEDKDRMVNPELVVCCANDGYPRMNCIASPEAFLRRRDFVVFCELSEKYQVLGCRNADDPRITAEDLREFNHMQFTVKNVFKDVNIREKLDYKQLLDYLKNESVRISERRSVAATRRAHFSGQLSPTAWQRRLEEGLIDPTVEATVRSQIAIDTEMTLYDRIEQTEVTGECDYCEMKGFIQSEQVENLPPNISPIIPDDVSDASGVIVIPCFCPTIQAYGEFCPDLWGFTLDKQYVCDRIKNINNESHVFVGMYDYCGDGCCTQDYALRFARFCAAWPQRFNGAFIHMPNLADSVLRSPHFQDYFNDLEGEMPPRALRYAASSWRLDEYEGAPDPLASAFSNWCNNHIFAVKVGLFAVLGLTIVTCVYAFFAIVGLLYSLCDSFLGRFKSWVAKIGISMVSRVVFQKFVDKMVASARDIYTLGPVVGQMTGSGDVRTGARVASYAIRGQMDSHSVYTGEEISDPPEGEVSGVDQLLSNNTMWMLCKMPGDVKIWSRMLCIEGRTCIAPWHYFVRLRKLDCQDVEVHDVREGDRVVYRIPFSNLEPRRIKSFDLCAFNLPARVPLKRSIVQLFADERYIQNVFNGKGRVVEKISSKVPSVTSVNMKAVVGTCEYDDELMELVGYCYDYHGAGKCMSVLVGSDANVAVGVHVCGGEGRGFCLVLTKKILQAAIDQLSLHKPLPAEKAIVKPDTLRTPIMELYGQAELIGATPKNLVMRYPAKTEIRPSPMTGVLCEPVRFPAKLRHPGEKAVGYGPLSVGASKQLNPPLPFNQNDLDIAVYDVVNMILSKAPPTGNYCKSKRSMKEAIFGIQGKPFCEGIRLNTSPGYPFCVMYKGDKTCLFEKLDRDKQEFVLKEEVLKMYELEHAERLNSCVPECVYADFLKDERLVPGKDTRLVNGQSFTELIEFRRYCMDFMSAFTAANLDCQHAIGMNVFGHGFQRIAEKLIKVSRTRILTGDYSKFGPTLQAECVARIPDIMEIWYRSYSDDLSATVREDNMVRRILYESLCNCVHVAGDLFYRTQCGSPSGNCYTVQNNTLVNLLYLRVCWLVVFRGTTYESMKAFNELFAPVCLGDDFVGAVSQEVAEVFNNVTMSETFAKYGIKFTDAVKSGKMRPYCRLDEASFLKCTFARAPDDRDLWVAQLEKTVIEDIVNWQRFKGRDEGYLKEIADMVCRYAFLYGEAYFDTVRDKMQKWFQVEGIHWTPLSYDVLWLNIDGDTVDWIENWHRLGL